MPHHAPRICGCGRKVHWDSQCPCEQRRERQRRARADANRPSARQRGYDSKWQRESKAFLALPQNRYCRCGCGRLADMVDHIIPHRGDMRLFWDRSNWQPLASSPCHSRFKQRAEAAR
jgi:5-methylcytosine-specific restriction enzyme A